MIFTVSGKLLDACVLGIVNEKDSYGYDLTQKISSSMEVSESALYPVLRRLSKENLLTTYDQAFEGRNRKYYQITTEGKLRLEYYIEEWENHQSMVSKLMAGGQEVTREEQCS